MANKGTHIHDNRKARHQAKEKETKWHKRFKACLKISDDGQKVESVFWKVLEKC